MPIILWHFQVKYRSSNGYHKTAKLVIHFSDTHHTLTSFTNQADYTNVYTMYTMNMCVLLG